MKKLHKYFLAGATLFIVVLISGWQYSAQPYFEGEIIYRLGLDGSSGAVKDMPQKITLSYRGNRMKMTSEGGKMEMDMIYDLAGEIKYKIDHENKIVYKKPQDINTEQYNALFKGMEFTIEAKADTPAIAGYKCKRHVITAEMPPMAMTIDLFTTHLIRVPAYAGSNPIMDQMGLNMDDIKGFPLGMKFGFHFRGKSETMMMEAEEVNEKKIPLSFFELPKDYEVVER